MKVLEVLPSNITLFSSTDFIHALLQITRVYPKVSGLSQNEIYANNNKHSLISNIKVYGGKTH
jgi:hypothetical protein